MTVSAQQAIERYAYAYQKLYQQSPTELYAIDAEWIVVDGYTVHVEELEDATAQLVQALDQTPDERRQIVYKLMAWFSQ